MTSTNEYNDEDIVVESEEQTDGFGRTQKEKKLKAKLKEVETKAAEHLEGWQRAKADLINFKKESENRQANIVTFATEGLIEELLPILDSFEMAMGNEEVWNSVDENWRKGIEHINSQITTVLKGRGLAEIYPQGEKFDPNFHQPVETIVVADPGDDEKIQKVVQKGYQLHDKILRPARVIVGKHEVIN